MSNPIVALLENELVWFDEIWGEDRNRAEGLRIFPPKDNLYPLPSIHVQIVAAFDKSLGWSQ